MTWMGSPNNNLSFIAVHDLQGNLLVINAANVRDVVLQRQTPTPSDARYEQDKAKRVPLPTTWIHCKGAAYSVQESVLDVLRILSEVSQIALLKPLNADDGGRTYISGELPSQTGSPA